MLANPPQRVLLIKPSAIGDVVHALPVLGLMRRRWPDAHIAWLVTPACAGLLEGHPQLSELLLFDRRGLAGWYRSGTSARGLLALGRTLRQRRFDLVLDLQGLFRSGILTWATRAPVRVGLASAREGATAFYTHKVPAGETQRHAIDKYLDAAEFLGLGRSPIDFTFNTTPAHRAAVQALLAPLGTRPYAVLLPGANWTTKRWPAEHFATLTRHLQRDLGLAVVVAGGASDHPLAHAIAPDLSLCGQTTLPQTTALLESAAVVIANDTGPMHVAAALGTPLVTLFGPTSPVRTGPYRRPLTVLRTDLPCAPCLSRKCSHMSCLHWLSPEHVLSAVRNALAPR